jgi:predicted NAD-dependent protein-ADP-ribosyltransferase YbiA (DUF1768 family)
MNFSFSTIAAEFGHKNAADLYVCLAGGDELASLSGVIERGDSFSVGELPHTVVPPVAPAAPKKQRKPRQPKAAKSAGPIVKLTEPKKQRKPRQPKAAKSAGPLVVSPAPKNRVTTTAGPNKKGHVGNFKAQNGMNPELSNFYLCCVVFNGNTFLSVEHAYQSLKLEEGVEHFAAGGQLSCFGNLSEAARQVLFPDGYDFYGKINCDGIIAKKAITNIAGLARVGIHLTLSHTEFQPNDRMWITLLWQKFQLPSLKEKLLGQQLRGVYLCESNRQPLKSFYGGKFDPETQTLVAGKNRMGKYLMEIRLILLYGLALDLSKYSTGESPDEFEVVGRTVEDSLALWLA